MRKISNRVISILLVMIITSIIISPTKILAASAQISATSTNIYVGETSTINVSISSTEAWSINLKTTGGSLSETKSADAAGAEVSKTVLSSIFSANSAGTYTISLSGTVTGSDLQKQNISGNITITVKEKETTPSDGNNEGTTNEPATGGDTNNGSSGTQTPTSNPNNSNTSTDKSRNNSLKSLSVSKGTLSPAFHRDTTDYTVTFADDFDLKALKNIKVTAKAEDSKSKISGDGTIELNDGENNIKINVTAENGSIKTYNIKLTKPVPLTQSDLRLKTLEVNQINKDGKFIKAILDKDFDPEIFEYSCEAEADITDLDISATVEKEGIIVSIDGATNLKDGENIATIKLTSKDDETVQTTYSIKVKKQAEIVETSTNTVDTNATTSKVDNKTVIATIIAVIAILLIILIVLIVINNKKKKNNIKYSNHNKKSDEDDNLNTTEDELNIEKTSKQTFKDNIFDKLENGETENNVLNNKLTDLDESIDRINNKFENAENKKIDLSKLEKDNESEDDEYEKIQRIMHPKINLEELDTQDKEQEKQNGQNTNKLDFGIFDDKNNEIKKEENIDTKLRNIDRNFNSFNEDSRIKFDDKQSKTKHKGKHF